MTASEKAEELVEKFAPIMPNEDWKVKAIECAKICVDEIIKSIPCKFDGYEYQSNFQYWQEVKTELDKL